MGGHQPARLVIPKQPGALARRQRLAVDGDDVVAGDIERRRIDEAAVDGDAALHDPFLGVAARGQPRPRQHLGDALAGFLFTRRPRRAPLVGRALAIGATAAERRTLGENLAVVLVVAARPVGIAARMLLPGGAGFARTLELRTILARTRKPRTLVAAAVLARFVKTSSAFPRRARIAAGMVGRRRIALLPG